MSWGTQRRNTIVTIFILFVLIISGFYLFDTFYEAPNCFDGKINGNEIGLDCGGSCKLLCENQVLDPIIRWTRLFEVSPGIYNVLAYVENPNPTGGVENVGYRFRIFDEKNILLQERKGNIKLSPRSVIPVIENSLVAGKLDATRVSFEFITDLVWTRQEIEKSTILVQDEELLTVETEPRIIAILTNTGIVPIDEVKVIVIVYNKEDNAIASSSTFLERIPASGSAQVFFTWPVPFSDDVSRFEIIPVYERSSR